MANNNYKSNAADAATWASIKASKSINKQRQANIGASTTIDKSRNWQDEQAILNAMSKGQ